MHIWQHLCGVLLSECRSAFLFRGHAPLFHISFACRRIVTMLAGSLQGKPSQVRGSLSASLPVDTFQIFYLMFPHPSIFARARSHGYHLQVSPKLGCLL